MQSNIATAITLDNSNNVLVAFRDIGIMKYDGVKWSTILENFSYFIKKMEVDKLGNIWAGTSSGVIKISNVNVTYYNMYNSGIPSDYVNDLALDSNGNIWIATDGQGVAKFNGTTWSLYKTSNSGLTNNTIYSIAIDKKGVVWCGYWGLVKFNGTTWTEYNSGNSAFPGTSIDRMEFDDAGNLWMASSKLIKFDGTNFTSYALAWPNFATDIAVDESGNKWVGSTLGLYKFDNSSKWTMIDVSNSGLTVAGSWTIAFDKTNTKWIASNSQIDGLYSLTALPGKHIMQVILDLNQITAGKL